ncbi:hypothetical protein PK98_14015 [Croceibacterium mercuriale]|uniref:Uncharacterized protein n=1 Tax=Croceibacterium mercuriale TaxID=1572751 RepID=A0A0B2BZ35_9SPHN|nr:DUF1800 domain-containing protein [Croceibacterium mercuriale]KHL24961.1 hypothetical protein PK98_14015 [Croceibacterium mercuriale]
MQLPEIAVNRFGLGARPGEGLPGDPRAWLLGQFDRYDPRPPAIAEAPSQPEAAAALADYAAAAREGRMQRNATAAPSGAASMPADADPAMRDPAMQARRTERRNLRDLYAQSVAARGISALTTPTPFMDRLVHFWSNHFAISAEKPPVIAMAGSFEFDAIRPHVLGSFGDMLRAVERHPAMLTYLDQAQSVGPGSPAGQRAGANGRTRGLNENLAREILELHTLGVRGGYDQADIGEFARALTGWSVAGGARRPARRRAAAATPGGFAFVPAMHEPGTRTILGRTFDAGGEEQGQAVLDMLAAHAATAHHVATKLARHFVADTPPPALVSRLEQAFLQADGDLPTLYRALIDAPEAWSPTPAKFKTPWEWAVSALRATGAETFPTPNVLGFVTQLGQAVWRPGSPAGFDDVAASWAGPDAVMRRVEVAERLAARAQGMGDTSAVAAALFGGTLTAQTATAIARAESPTQGLALLLVSPDFMRR